MSALKRKGFSFKVLFLLLFLLVLGGGLIWYFRFREPPSFVEKSDPVEASENQAELINAFGYPDVFMLSMEREDRYEVWGYHALEKSFVFWNGTFVEDQVIADVSDEFQFPDFRPTQFKNQATLAEVNEILGDPGYEGEINPKLIENAKVYDYWDQVKVGTKGDEVVYVETLPVFIPEEYRVKDEG